jgi:hypothetical protein
MDIIVKILPVVFCGCETWSPTLREEHRLMVFENSGENCIRRTFMISGPRVMKQEE